MLPNHLSSLPDNFVCTLDSMGVIHVSGQEAHSYLQGQITVDVMGLADDTATLGCHCDSKGKTWSVFYLFAANDGLNLLAHPESTAASLAELKKYGVFSKVDIRDDSKDFRFFGGWGEALEAHIRTLFVKLPEQHLAVITTAAGSVMRIDSPKPRYLLMLTPESQQPILDAQDLQDGDEAVWEALDIQAGIANVQSATLTEFVPQMMNMQALGAISFEKGCYMGQETVARTKFLGRNKRAAFILRATTAVSVAAGDTLELQIGDNWRRGGTVLRSATLGDESWILAVLANDTEIGSQLRLKDQPDTRFEVLALPYAISE